MNDKTEKTCQQLLTAFFKKFPNHYLQAESYCTLKTLLNSDSPMLGKPGGWAGGIIYALCNRCKRACGIPGLLNKDCEEFFDVSMGTIYKRAWMIRRMLGGESTLPISH